jgi:hypothetical protein
VASQFKVAHYEAVPQQRTAGFVRLKIVVMARGWESKSVEQQQELATSEAEQRKPQLSPAQISAEQRRQALQLSRQRILQQLEVASNPRHRQMLEAALADLEAQLARERRGQRAVKSQAIPKQSRMSL